MVENVFVVGLNDHSAAILRRLPDADRYRFHRLLDPEVLLFSDTIPLPELLMPHSAVPETALPWMRPAGERAPLLPA